MIDETLIKSSTLTNFFREINDSFSIHQPLGLKDEESDKIIIDYKYVDICNFSPPKNNKNLSIFHTNIGSLEKHIDELKTVLTMIDHKFDIIGITESKIKKEA